MNARWMALAAAMAGTMSAAAPASAQLLFSSLSARNGDDEFSTRSYLPGATIAALSADGYARVTTDVGINKIAARETAGDGVEAGSLWGANFKLTSASTDMVRIRMNVRLDGTATALPEASSSDDPPLGFNYQFGAVRDRVASFDTSQSDGDIDAILLGAHDVIQVRNLCDGNPCEGFGAYDNVLSLDFMAGGNDEFFVYGLLQLVDLHFADFAFANTAILTDITVDGAALLSSDTGRLVRAADGTYRFAQGVPEPATWAMMIGGFGMAGGAVRRRKTIMSVTLA